jgi:hypothetical protein
MEIVGVTTIAPTGCLHAVITLFGSGSNQYLPKLNHDAIFFVENLNSIREFAETVPLSKLAVICTT